MSERLVTIGCKIPQEMFDEVQDVLVKYGLTQSVLLRVALKEFLESLRENTSPAVNPQLTEALLRAHRNCVLYIEA